MICNSHKPNILQRISKGVRPSEMRNEKYLRKLSIKSKLFLDWYG